MKTSTALLTAVLFCGTAIAQNSRPATPQKNPTPAGVGNAPVRSEGVVQPGTYAKDPTDSTGKVMDKKTKHSKSKSSSKGSMSGSGTAMTPTTNP